ncbi:glycosyltransferase [Salinisphaera sp. PC39]|uniref:glycosyltransferase family 4 protein n=1 Tax=Salinisphaera sp. PC39 TaxID=1304156 RepID=UPI00333EC031
MADPRRRSGGRRVIPVCHVNLARGFRGGERQTELLVRALAERGVPQRIVTRRGQPLGSRLADVPGLARREVARPFLRALPFLRGCIVHAHEAKAAHLAHWAHILTRTPYLITRRVDNAPGRSRTTRAMYRAAARVVVLSDAIGAVMRDYDPGLDTVVIPSASAGLAADRARTESLRRSWSGDLVIGHVGALHHAHKGQGDLIEAFARLAPRHPGLRLVLVGDGVDEARFRARAADTPGVIFAGRTDNVGDYLAAFDIFAYPSLHEGLGSALLDAMQAGLPIAATRVGGIPELVTDGDNGLLAEPGDPAGLAHILERLVRDPALRRRLGEAGRRRVAAYAPAAMAERYLALYRELGVL